MENFADEIEKLILDKLGLYEKIYELLIQEHTYVAKVKVDALWETTARKKSLIYRVELIRHKIAEKIAGKYPGIRIDAQSFGLKNVIKRLNIEPAKRFQLEKLILSIHTKKDDIASLARENSKYINENLFVINGIFSTIMDSREKEEEYSPSGSILNHGNQKRLFNAQV